MRKIIRFMKRVAISGLSTSLRMWIFKYVGNSSVDKVICGAWNFPGRPGTLWSGRPCWPVSHKAKSRTLASDDIISKMRVHVTWPHGVQPMQHKMQYVWITKNPYWTDVHIYELQLKAKCHKLHKLEKEKLKQLQELNHHLILPNFIVKKRNCAVIWPNWTQNWFQIQ